MLLLDSPLTPYSSPEDIAAWAEELQKLLKTCPRQYRAKVSAAIAALDVQKYNPNHKPAGTSQGGQFTSGGGATTVARTLTIQHHGHDFPDVEELSREMFGSARAIKDYGTAVAKQLQGEVIVRYETGVKYHKEFLGITIQDGRGVHLERTFMTDPDTGKPYVIHDNFNVPRDLQGQGIGNAVARANFKQYAKMGLTHVETYANVDVGSYAWARMGFVPVSSGAGRWERLARTIRERVDDDTPPLSVANKAKVKALLDGPPENIRKIAALRSGESNIGRHLLMNSHWEGRLDLRDAATMKVVRSYLKKK